MKLDRHIIQATRLSPNSTRALLHYKAAFESPSASDIERHFQRNDWDPQWRFPMYKHAHYHSKVNRQFAAQGLTIVGTTHEALGVFVGSARLRFGISDKETDRGLELDVQAGDVLVIPAGVMHRAVTDRDEFCMVGAYPKDSRPWDMNFGRSEEECKDKRRTIEALPDPAKDPFTGQTIWNKEAAGNH